MRCEIEGDRLTKVDGRAVQVFETPHQGARMVPSLIVLHDTAGRLEKMSSVSWFLNPASKVSAHLVIERDGSVTQLASFDKLGPLVARYPLADRRSDVMAARAMLRERLGRID